MVCCRWCNRRGRGGSPALAAVLQRRGVDGRLPPAAIPMLAVPPSTSSSWMEEERMRCFAMCCPLLWVAFRCQWQLPPHALLRHRNGLSLFPLSLFLLFPFCTLMARYCSFLLIVSDFCCTLTCNLQRSPRGSFGLCFLLSFGLPPVSTRCHLKNR